MGVVVRGILKLQPGCRLFYDCPLGGESYEADQFFNHYRHTYAEFVDYSYKFVGLLDINGQIPGTYFNQDGFKVRFEGEEKVHELNSHHFVVVDPQRAELQAEDVTRRVGDLPHPILYYPDDIVRVKKQADLFGDETHKIGGISLDGPEGRPRYQVMESQQEAAARQQKSGKEPKSFPDLMHRPLFMPSTNRAGDDLELVARGNVWALYNDSSKFSFRSEDAEAGFWVQSGISICVASSKEKALGTEAWMRRSVFGYSRLKEAWRIFEAGEADLIRVPSFRNLHEAPTFQVFKLHDCFAAHRERVRALTERLWLDQVKSSAA